MIQENSKSLPWTGSPTASSARWADAVQEGAQRSYPRLGIGMPVYNAEDYLPLALDSLLNQSFTDFEIVVCDNASDDRTQEICLQYAKNDSRIRYIRDDVNRGAAHNFTRVFQLSRGEYFKWAAADDLCHPDFLQRCVELLDAKPEVVCCHSHTTKIDAQGHMYTELPDPTDAGFTKSQLAAGERRPDAHSESVARRFRDVLCNTGWSCRSYGVIRRQALAFGQASAADVRG